MRRRARRPDAPGRLARKRGGLNGSSVPVLALFRPGYALGPNPARKPCRRREGFRGLLCPLIEPERLRKTGPSEAFHGTASSVLYGGKLFRNARNVSSLETGDGQFVLGGLTASVIAGQRACPVRRSSRDLAHGREFGHGIRHPNDDHPVMKKRCVEGRDGGLLSSVLRAC